MPIPDWPDDERPREKLLNKGAHTLSDAELLAIFLRTGVAGKSAVDVARELVARFKGLSKLIAASPEQFYEAPGLGPAKYAQLQAAVELARRALSEKMRASDVLSSPKAVRDYLRLQIGGREHEVFLVIFLDAQNRVIACEDLFRGTLTETSVYPREVVKRALQHNAAAVIFAHNHRLTAKRLNSITSRSDSTSRCPQKYPLQSAKFAWAAIRTPQCLAPPMHASDRR